RAVAVAELRDHARAADTGLHAVAQPLAVRRRDAGRTGFAEGQLGVLVEVAAECDELGLEGARALEQAGHGGAPPISYAGQCTGKKRAWTRTDRWTRGSPSSAIHAACASTSSRPSRS